MTTETKETTKKKTKKKESADDPKPKSIWKNLSRIDCSSFTKEKNGLTYLSWTHAWHAVKDLYPDAMFHKHKNESGYPAFCDQDGNAFVRVSVTIEDQHVTEDLPVLGYKNKGEKDPDAFRVNTSLQRCLVKCLAYLGLGIHIYMGEDLPLSDREELMLIVHARMIGDDEWQAKVFEHFNIRTWEELPLKKLEQLVEKITVKKETK